MTLTCRDDERRDKVRSLEGWTGLDYVEVSDDQMTLYAYFLGKLPPELKVNKPGLEMFLVIEGGTRITGIQVTDVDPVVNADPDRDDYLVIDLDRYGDFSTYTLRLVGVAKTDPRYDHVDFSFKVNCPSDLDCRPPCTCEPASCDEPDINYLAKDYTSFRQLLADRLAVLIPDWKEWHAPDIGNALLDILAYTGDYLSYYQDAVATEAYLDTARQRISVRRHARLVDYKLHEGCNARAWVCVSVSQDISIDAAPVSFITGLNNALSLQQSILSWDDLRAVDPTTYEVFEPVLADSVTSLQFRAAHNEIQFYTWGEKECCLEKGSTSAALVDHWSEQSNPAGAAANDQKQRVLNLSPGDALIFEEVVGPQTGVIADADPLRRHAVRLTKVTAGEDPVNRTDEAPTPYIEIEWGEEDRLPFSFCISTIGPAPDCQYLPNVSVALGNVVLVDNGHKLPPEDLGTVPSVGSEACCECANQPGDVTITAGRFEPQLSQTPLTYRQLLPRENGTGGIASASAMLQQDARRAHPQLGLTSDPAKSWHALYDLVDSGSADADFIVEIDNFGIAHLRFGSGQMGWLPSAGMSIKAVYRIGNGAQGNVGAEAISRLVLSGLKIDGTSITVRNPLPATGGIDPETIAEAKLFAPHQFRKQLERAITAEDYAVIAERNAKIQNAAAVLAWTGSWYEADVSVDPLGSETCAEQLLSCIDHYLERYRRIGHDLAVGCARYVPIDLAIDVCALPFYDRGHVKAALLDVFSNRVLAGGKNGFFHPDNVSFGDGIYLSQIIAIAQSVVGVECVRVTTLQRQFTGASGELENGLLPLSSREIAQLDNDPNHPERGHLQITVLGGR